jgi:ribosomal protein S18 acetylase RimI-like enzyme
MTRPTSRDALAVLLAGLAGKNAHFPDRFGAPAEVHRTSRHTIIDSGLASDTFNLVVEHTPGNAPHDDREVDAICERFAGRGLPVAWWTCDELRDDRLAAALARNGFVEDEVDVGMTSDLAALPRELPHPAGFGILRATSPDDLEAYGRIIEANFDPPDAAVMSYYRAVSRLPALDHDVLQLFLGVLDGRAVCTSSLYLSDQVAHLFDVCTLAAFRGRGLATAITHATLVHGRAHGARTGGLEASPGGLTIYRRLGFDEVGRFRVYSNKRQSSLSTSRDRHDH